MTTKKKKQDNKITRDISNPHSIRGIGREGDVPKVRLCIHRVGGSKF